MATDKWPINFPLPFCEKGGGRFFSVRYFTPSTCYEAKDHTSKEPLLTGTLFAEGTSKIVHTLYPAEVHSVTEAFMPYDEPVHPIPVGASVFYFIMIAWVTTFYFTYLGRKFLANVKQKLDLHPDATRFPNLPLYWIQQSKREAELRREVRNTWAWLARRYLLSPNDPLLDNVDQVLGLVNWHDFEVSRTTWSLIKLVLTVNALYVKVRRKEKERKGFEIVKSLEKATRRGREEEERIYTTRVFEEGAEHEWEEEGEGEKRRILTFGPSPVKFHRREEEETEEKRVLEALLKGSGSGGIEGGERRKELKLLHKMHRKHKPVPMLPPPPVKEKKQRKKKEVPPKMKEIPPKVKTETPPKMKTETPPKTKAEVPPKKQATAPPKLKVVVPPKPPKHPSKPKPEKKKAPPPRSHGGGGETDLGEATEPEMPTTTPSPAEDKPGSGSGSVSGSGSKSSYSLSPPATPTPTPSKTPSASILKETTTTSGGATGEETTTDYYTTDDYPTTGDEGGKGKEGKDVHKKKLRKRRRRRKKKKQEGERIWRYFYNP